MNIANALVCQLCWVFLLILKTFGKGYVESAKIARKCGMNSLLLNLVDNSNIPINLHGLKNQLDGVS